MAPRVTWFLLAFMAHIRIRPVRTSQGCQGPFPSFPRLLRRKVLEVGGLIKALRSRVLGCPGGLWQIVGVCFPDAANGVGVWGG